MWFWFVVLLLIWLCLIAYVLCLWVLFCGGLVVWLVYVVFCGFLAHIGYDCMYCCAVLPFCLGMGYGGWFGFCVWVCGLVRFVGFCVIWIYVSFSC